MYIEGERKKSKGKKKCKKLKKVKSLKKKKSKSYVRAEDERMRNR